MSLLKALMAVMHLIHIDALTFGRCILSITGINNNDGLNIVILWHQGPLYEVFWHKENLS